MQVSQLGLFKVLDPAPVRSRHSLPALHDHFLLGQFDLVPLSLAPRLGSAFESVSGTFNLSVANDHSQMIQFGLHVALLVLRLLFELRVHCRGILGHNLFWKSLNASAAFSAVYLLLVVQI